MKKLITTFLFVFCVLSASAQSKLLVQNTQQHPCIYTSASDKPLLQQKIAHEPWASEAFRRIQSEIEPYADRHVTDPNWITSRLAMYWKDGERYTQCYLKKQNWDRGEGNAPVPTVRMPGMRTWNKYYNVPLEERPAYNKTGDMWGIDKMNPAAPKVLVPYKESGHMIRGNNVEILTLAEQASFLYWITNEEKYARFAADIFNTWLVGTYYMNPILDPTKSCGSEGGWTPGGICGYYDYEQIHDDLALHAATVYDFLYDYLAQHPHSHLGTLGKTTKDVAATVFKRFIDIGFVRGGKEGNWNVNGWNMMLRPILVLEENSAYPDGKGRQHYLHYLTTESTPYHDAIPDMLKSYDLITGLWPESPGYSFGTIQMLLDFSVQLQRTGMDIVAGNPILQKAALAAFPWMDERANMVVFGDSRGGSANFLTFEYLLTYYTRQQKTEGINQVAVALNKGVELGQYDRSTAGWEGICTYLASIPDATAATTERTSYSAHHRFMTQKNFTNVQPTAVGSKNLMATLYGGRKGYHLTPNGLALQLYGYGYALAPDAAAYESYWSKDHTYHQSPTGCNTILPGYTEGDVTLNAAEPRVQDGSFTNDKELTPYINFADLTAGEKRRTVVLVKNSAGQGYYVDIFRSDLADNDYLHHNIGTLLTLTDARNKSLTPTPVNDLGTEYHAGYAWFTNQRKIRYDGDFKACWQMPEDITMNMWMLGAKGRELYQVDAPATTLNKGLTPGNSCMPPTATPTLIVRQRGNNALKHPFVAVFEPSKGEDKAVLCVNRLAETEQLIALQISSEGKREDYLFSAMMQGTKTGGVQNLKGTSFEGIFGFVTEVADKPEMLYLGNGKLLRKGSFAIEAADNVYAAIYQQQGEWYYSATGKVTVTLGKKKLTLDSGCHLLIPTNTAQVSPYNFTPMDSLISHWMERGYYPGASIFIAKNDTVLFEKQYGTYTPDTEVYIASAGKWLAAATIAAVVDQTKLSWDDSVQRWLPEFSNDPKGNITLKQLLSHTSGIRPYQPEPKRDVHNVLADAVAEILPLDTLFAAGSRFEYGGLAMQVAGRMAEVATGMDFETIFQQKIAQPLGMKHTHFTPVDLGGGHSPMLGGGARTVLHDYVRFLNMIFHEGNYQGLQVLSKQVVREMQADQVRRAKVLPGEYVEKGLGLHHTGIYGLGEWREKVDAQGEAYQISSPGWAGAYPWINKRDGVYGFFLTHVQGDAARKDGFSPFYDAPMLSELTTKLLQ